MQSIMNDTVVGLGNLDDEAGADASCAGPSDRLVNEVNDIAE